MNRSSILIVALLVSAFLPFTPARARVVTPGPAVAYTPQASPDKPDDDVKPQQATTTYTGTTTLRVAQNDIADRSIPRYPRQQHLAVRLSSGNVLLVGGFQSNNASSPPELYEPATNTFTNTKTISLVKNLQAMIRLRDGKVLLIGQTVEVYDPADDMFTPASDMLQPRVSFSAVLLADGRVLVSGGVSASGTQVLASSELFDPATGKWSATGDMNAARGSHAGVLLQDGRVLIAGGVNRNVLNSAEVYDPATGTWSATDAMSSARFNATATRLTDGTVLVAGGAGSDTSTSTAERYNPTTGSWTVTGPMQTMHSNHTANLLQDGTVLVIGGGSSRNITSVAERYDPMTNSWTSTGRLNLARSGHTATLLPDGRVLVVGGATSTTRYGNASAELYDPLKRTFSYTGLAQTRRADHTATRLNDGTVLIVSLDGTHRYDPTLRKFIPVAQTSARGHTATVLADGRVLLVSGYQGLVYDPTSDTWSATGRLNQYHFDHTATLLRNGKVLVAGGQNNDAELYDPAMNQWTATQDMHFPRQQHTATLLQDGTVLVVGGTGQFVDPTTTSERYDPQTGTWTLTANLNRGHTDHSATLLPDGRVLVLPYPEIYDPATDTWTGNGALVRETTLHTATLMPDGGILVTGGRIDSGSVYRSIERYDPRTGSSVIIGHLNRQRFSHTATLLEDGSVLIDGSENDYIAPRAERIRASIQNIFTGTLTVPRGWVTTTTPTVTFTGDTTSAPLDAGSVNDGPFVAAQADTPTPVTLPALRDGRDQAVTLRLRDANGNVVTVVIGRIDIDATAPTSSLTALGSFSPGAVQLAWSGNDATSGVASYDVEARAGDGAWTPVVTNTTARSTTFNGVDGVRYGFRVRARDVAGVVEAWPTTPDAQTTVDAIAPNGVVDISTVGDGSVLVLLAATDAGSGVSEMRVGFSSAYGSAVWEPFAQSKILSRLQVPAGCLIVQAQFRDRVGNTSPIISRAVPNTGCSSANPVYLPLVRTR